LNFLDAYDCAFKIGRFQLKQTIVGKSTGTTVNLGTYDDWDVIQIDPSNCNESWISDFDFFSKTFRNRKRRPDYADDNSPIRVHGGYLDCWISVRLPSLIGTLNSRNILVTGFSMGGGISNIAAVDFQHNRDPKTYDRLVCVDFEGARIWNKAGMLSYNKRVPSTYKIAYGNDAVTKMVPWDYYGGKQFNIGPKRLPFIFSIRDHIDVQRPDLIKPLLPIFDL
jgi:hypothetical protein